MATRDELVALVEQLDEDEQRPNGLGTINALWDLVNAWLELQGAELHGSFVAGELQPSNEPYIWGRLDEVRKEIAFRTVRSTQVIAETE